MPVGIKGSWPFLKIEINIPSTIFRNCGFIDSEGLWLKRLEHFILFLFDPFYPFYLFINQISISLNLIALFKFSRVNKQNLEIDDCGKFTHDLGT
jgi:hypothetical protein